MSAFFEWVQGRLHSECDTVIAFYDQDRRTAAEAQVASATAHHEAEQALAEARQQIARLESEAAGERARADKVQAALDTVRRTITEPVDLTRPRIDWADEITTKVINTSVIRNALRNEAARNPGHYGEHMHALADRVHAGVLEALEATKTDDTASVVRA